MKAIRICLLLLTVLGATVARAWTPVGSEFEVKTIKTYKVVNWRFGGSGTWDVRSRAAGDWVCTAASWIASPTNGINPRPGNGNFCEIEDATALQPDAPVAFQACYPAFTLNWPSLEITGLTYVDVPASVGSVADRFYKFTDACTHLVTGQFSTPEERLSLRQALAAGLLDTSAALNAWTKTQPLRFLTDKEATWRNAELAASNSGLKVAPISSGTRPYGTINSAGTGITKKGDVAVGTPCDGTKRIGQTSYYAVPSKGAGMYALCAVQ